MANKIYNAPIDGTIDSTRFIGGKWEVKLTGATKSAVFYLDTVLVAIGDKISYGDVVGYEIIEVAGSGSGSSSPTLRVGNSFFYTATKFRHLDLVGKRLIIYDNKIGRYLDDAEWNFTDDGVNILLGDFDSNTQIVDLVITPY